MKWVVCLLTLFALQANELPFWKAKPRLYERVENGEIIVSVRSEEISKTSPRHTLRLGGGGQTRAPRAFVFATAQRYAELPRASDYIKACKFDAEKQQVTMNIEAYGYKSELVVEVHPVHDVEPWRIDYRMVRGPMPGLSGQVTFADLGKSAEVGIDGEYKYDKFPIPRLFLEFGMEVVMQRMANRLRAFVQEEWHKNKGAVASP